MSNDFVGKLNYSKGIRQRTDLETLRSLITGCVSVTKTGEQLDRRGVDYVAVLRGGAEVLIDAKTREPGSRRWWRYVDDEGRLVPEVACEIYSVRPGGKYNTPVERRAVGWTLSESSPVDLIYYTFDPCDSDTAFLFPFQHLRMAFVSCFHRWCELYGRKIQDNICQGLVWESEAVFVPVEEVCVAIQKVMKVNGK